MELVPHICTMRPATDLCFVCHQNNDAIQKATNLRVEKSERLKLAEAHLHQAKVQRVNYNDVCANAKAERDKFHQTASRSDKYKGPMHYSFDFAQGFITHQICCNLGRLILSWHVSVVSLEWHVNL